MSTTKKTVLFIIILLLLFWPKDGGGIFTPKVDPNDFIFEPDSLAVASLYSMLETASQPPIKPDDLADKCNCNRGKISYDGGTSLTDCPCKINGTKCKCADCPYNKTGSTIPTSVSIEDDESYIIEDYYVIKVTAGWCAPCAKWNVVVKPSFETENIFVKEMDFDSNPSFVKNAQVETIPHFLIGTRVDGLYHAKYEGGFWGHNGPDFSVKQYKDLVRQLDKRLHPNRKVGLLYKRMQKAETKLNGKFWATTPEYIVHLSNHSNHKNDIVGWPLEKLSTYELKAIHDDDHADKLGPLAK